MAANMQQMAAGQMMGGGQPRRNAELGQQVGRVVMSTFQNSPQPTSGWQSVFPLNDRVGKTTNLISNMILGMPNQEWRNLISQGIAWEQKQFTEMPDRAMYEKQMNGKLAELVARRQANDGNLRMDLNNQQQAAQQAAMAQQQQQLMMNRAQFQGMPNQQAGLQHLQHQMQVSPIPQQQQQQIGFNMPNAAMGMGMGMNNPQMGQMGAMPGQMRPNMQQFDMSGLNDLDKAKVGEAAMKLAQQADNATKQQALLQLQAQFGPQWLQNQRSQGKDPLHYFFQRQAFGLLSKQAQIAKRNMQAGMAGLPPNASPAQIAMLQQQQQQQQQQRAAAAAAAMNPGMANPMGQQHGPQGAPFANFTDMNSIMNGQKEGMMAQQGGELVVPASSQPGTRTPQPMQGMPGHGMPNQQPQTPGQRPQGMPPQMFNNSQAQQVNGPTQAQVRAAAQMQAAKYNQGQNNLAGPVPGSQGPGMSTLNAPMQQPVPMGGMNGQQTPQAPMAFTPGMDPRFNQRPMGMQGNVNAQQAALLQQLTPEQRQKFSGLPPEKIAELIAKWQQSRNEGNQNAGQAMRGPGQMPQPMGNMGNAANQFGVAAGLPQQTNPQLQQQQAAAQAQQQQQQQQQLQMNQLQTQQMSARLGIPQAQHQVMMDQMDLPTSLLSQFPIPPEVKKWRDFKLWAAGAQLPDTARSHLANMQTMQFRMLLSKRNQNLQQPQAPGQGQAPNQPQMPTPGPTPQPPQNQVQVQAPAPGQAMPQGQGQQRPMPQAIPPQMAGTMPGQVPNVAAGMPQVPPGAQPGQVTPQEIASLRAKYPQLQNSDDDTIRRIATKLKHDMMMRNLAQHMRANGQNPPQQMPGAPGPQPAAVKPEAQPPAQPQAVPPKPAAPTAPVTTAPPAPAAPKAEAPAAAPTKRQPPTPNMAAPGGRKRPAADDAQDNAAKPAPGPQAGAGAQAPPPQQARPRLPAGITPEQFAKLTPEQQKEVLIRAQAAQQNVPPETKELLNKLRLIGSEEDKALKQQTFSDVHMSPEDKAATEAKLKDAVGAMRLAGKSLVHFYQATRDEARSRMFFRYRHRLCQQFVDQENTIPKPVLSIQGAELEQMKLALTQLVKEAEAGRAAQLQQKQNQAAGQRTGATAAPAAAPPMQQRPSQQQSQPAPLNQANLEENNRAHNKMHNRTNSKSGQGAPAAPTSTQPPFPIHAASPHGQPAYGTKPQLTQENLQLPNKRRKTSMAQPTTQPTPPAATPKMASPTITRQPAPAPQKPLLQCPELGCEMHTTGFTTEEARRVHIEEEHTKPYADPLSFFQSNLSSSLGLDASGHAPPAQPQPVANMGAPMEPSLSKQSQTPAAKVEAAGVSMSRAASMNRQGSGGAVVKPEMATPGKMTPAARPGATPRLNELKTPAPSMDIETHTVPAANNAWDLSFIDPQDLSAAFSLGGESAANGAISDFTIYRNAFTPNDTPESSKDSGSSEPNSDISESAHLDIDLNVWSADESLLLEEMTKISMRPMDDMEGADLAQAMMADPNNSMIDWDTNNLSSFYDKPTIELDPSLYSFDTL